MSNKAILFWGVKNLNAIKNHLLKYGLKIFFFINIIKHLEK